MPEQTHHQSSPYGQDQQDYKDFQDGAVADHHGEVLVVTASSRYLLRVPADGRAGTLRRLPGRGLATADGVEDGWQVSALRRDGEAVELLEIIELEVGRPARFWIRLYPKDEPALLTLRQTTPVQAIEHMS